MSEFASTGEFHTLALSKMTRILGAARARQLMCELLGKLGITLETADDLLQFSNELSKLRGFEGAVGAMLSVRALMSGASIKETDEETASRLRIES